jgi:hypothetical protein
MSTTPPEQPGTTTRTSGYGSSSRMNLPTDVARLPIPGNAEFAVYFLALIFAALVCWLADSLGSASWLDFAKWATAAYLLSRGIAKASRVLEQ